MKQQRLVILLVTLSLFSTLTRAADVTCTGSVLSVGTQYQGWLITQVDLGGGVNKVWWICRVEEDTAVGDPPPVLVTAPTCKSYERTLQLAFALSRNVSLTLRDPPTTVCRDIPHGAGVRTVYINTQQ